MNLKNAFRWSLLFLPLFFCSKVSAQITLINEEFGIKIYPRKCSDTSIVGYIKNYPSHKMKLYPKDSSGEIKIELFDKKGVLKLKGQFFEGNDTLKKYSFSKTLGVIDGKSHSNIHLLKYFYLIKSGTWLYFDNKMKVIRKEEYEYTYN